MKISCMNLEQILAMSPEEKWDFVCKDTKDDGKTGEVAILLGCRPERAIERAKAAAELYHTGRVKYIVASGGVKWEYCSEQISEAELMKRILLGSGVPESAILLENDARTTKENMICSTLVLNRTVTFSNINSVIIVTSEMHMQRSLALAKALFPRKFSISGYPSYPNETKEEWLTVENNRKILDNSIRLLKGLVDDGIVEDIDIDIGIEKKFYNKST